jgi:TonB family protein
MIKEDELPPVSGGVGVIGGVPGGVPGGTPGGVIGGIISSVPQAAPPPPPPVVKEAPKAVAPQRIRVGGNVQQAKLVNQPKPVYPPLAKQARIQGTVRFSATIGKDGDVKNLEAVSGHPLLVPAALESVKQWVYRPTLLNGMPVEVVTQIDVNFTLNGEAPAGVVGGVPGGVVGGVGRAYRVGDGVAAPKVVRKVEPQYPEALRHQGLSATVVLRVVISSDGKIGSALIERIDGQPAFGAAAIEAVRQWEFKPGMKDGQPVNVEATIEMNFRET